jgi:hypothetical protein
MSALLQGHSTDQSYFNYLPHLAFAWSLPYPWPSHPLGDGEECFTHNYMTLPTKLDQARMMSL